MDKICENYKNSLYSGLSKIGKCLSSEKRIEILDLLVQGAKTVESISNETGMSIANTSRHLQILKDGNLVISEKKGNYVVYEIANTQIIDLVYLLIGVGEKQLADIQRIHNEFNDSCMKIRPITLEQAYEMAEQNETLIIDLRPEDEFNSSHIEKIKNLPKDKKIIVYCRGRNCAYANLASKLLNNNGFQAYSLNQSYYDWQKNKNF